MPRQCPLHTCQVLKKIKIITQWCATSASGWGQGCFVENLHIIGLEFKLFFLQGGKDILTQNYLCMF